MKVQEHKRNFDPSSLRDYIDCFLAEMGEVRILMCVLMHALRNYDN